MVMVLIHERKRLMRTHFLYQLNEEVNSLSNIELMLAQALAQGGGPAAHPGSGPDSNLRPYGGVPVL
jgi:hypothetical protein